VISARERPAARLAFIDGLLWTNTWVRRSASISVCSPYWPSLSPSATDSIVSSRSPRWTTSPADASLSLPLLRGIFPLRPSPKRKP